MLKTILITLLAAAAALAQNAPAKAKTLTRSELDQLLASPDKVLLIDVRRPDEISANGGFPVYLSIQLAELEKHLDAIPRDRVIVTISNHAGRGAKAADLLASKGFNVAGTAGAQTYEKEGGTLTKVAIPQKAETAEK
jgi:rhodanese-related sulfurtransferase